MIGAITITKWREVVGCLHEVVIKCGKMVAKNADNHILAALT